MGYYQSRLLYRWIAVLWGICTLLSTTGSVQAAHIPPGVQLAAQQHLVINNGAKVQSLDPHKSIGMPEGNITRNLLEGLVNFDINGKMVPGVAQRWQASADYRQWTFYLRANAKWSNGDPVTAGDFVYSWQRLANPATKAPNANYLTDMRLLNGEAVIQGQQPPSALGVYAIDDHTLQLKLAQPIPFLVEMLADSSLYPLHPPTVEQYGNGVDDNKWYAVPHFVGNGAYRLQEWVVNEKIVLTRSASYWDNANTVIERVTFLPITDEVTSVRRYRAGEIDISHYLLPTENYLTLQQTHPQELRHFPSLMVRGYCFNTQRPPFNDVRVRQALALTIERENLVNRFLVQGEWAAYLLNPQNVENFTGVLPTWVAWPVEKRLAVARKLLKEAGYDKNRPLRFRLLYNRSEFHEQLAMAVSSIWKQKLGVEVTLDRQEWEVFLASCRTGEYQAARFGYRAVYNHPAALLNLLRANSSFNDCFYKSSAFDNWLDRALQGTTQNERSRCYQRAELVLAADVPITPVYYESLSRLVKLYVGGLSDGNPMAVVYIKDLYLTKHLQAPSRYQQ
ncbi:MAG: ABC transporter substrate-binding protein [Candidatus Symbiodolus clandestinus]